MKKKNLLLKGEILWNPWTKKNLENKCLLNFQKNSREIFKITFYVFIFWFLFSHNRHLKYFCCCCVTIRRCAICIIIFFVATSDRNIIWRSKCLLFCSGKASNCCLKLFRRYFWRCLSYIISEISVSLSDTLKFLMV